MNLTPLDLIRGAQALSLATLGRLSVHDVHEALEGELGALTDDEAYAILDLVSGAEVRI